MNILYASPVPRRDDHHDYRREIATIDAALACASGQRRATLSTLQFVSRADLRRGLLRRAHEIVVLAGHGPTLGLFEAATPAHRGRCAAVLAEELAICSAPNAWVLLMGCSTSWMAPALAERGLWGTSFDAPVPARAMRIFLGAFFDGVCAGRELAAAHGLGCMAMAYDYPDASRSARYFGASASESQARHHQWIVPPYEVEHGC